MPPPLIQIIQDPEFQNLPESEKIKAFQMFGATDPEWRGLSTRDKLKIQAYVGITRAQQVLARVPDTAKGPEGGVNLPPAVDEYVERAGRYASAVPNSIEELKKTASINAPLKTSLAAANAVFSPLYAGAGVLVGAPVEEAMSGAGVQNETAKRLVGEVATQAAMAAGMHGASPAPTAVEQDIAKGVPARAGGSGVKVVETPKGPIRIQGDEPMLVDTPDGPIEQNAPATPDRQAALNQKFGDGVNAAKTVVTDAGLPEPEITVGQTPISRSVVGEDGVGKIDLAQGTADEGAHEGLHVVADSRGTPHPPEDNNAIADAILKKGAQFENRGRAYRVERYDPDLGTYDVTDIKTGMRTQMPEESVKSGAAPAQPEAAQFEPAAEPDETIPVEEGMTPLEMENARSIPPKQAGVVGPKEAALQDEGVAPEWDVPPTGKPRGRAWKPDAVQPLPDTPAPKTPKEVQQRSIAYRALDRLTRAWQVAVTSHPGTASRIFFDNQIRVAIDAGATRSIGGFTGQFQAGRNAALIDELAGIHPEADLARFGLKGQVYEHGGKLGEALSTLTRLADTVPKEAVFVSRLEQTLARRGLKLWDLRESGALNKITLPELADAKYAGDWVGMSLDPKKDTDIQKIVTGLQTPVGRLFVGFGRMIYNRGLSLVQQNPLMYLKVASPEFRAALAARNPEAIKTAILPVVGTAAFAAGYVSAKRGENDPQALKAGMSKVDIGASYLFPMYAAGHALARMGDPSNHGGQQNINEAEMKNLANAVIGIPGGATSLVGAAMEADFADMKKAAANWAGGFSRTVKVVHDFLAAIDPEEAKARDTAGTWYGPFVKNIPWASKQLPEYKSQTKSAPVKQEHPLAEVVGAQIKQADTDVEDEFRRLGIRIPGKVSDDPEKNRAFRDNAGPEIEAAARMIMATKEYKSADDAGKHLQLSRVYQIVRKYAQEQEPVRNIDKKKLLQEQAVK